MQIRHPLHVLIALLCAAVLAGCGGAGGGGDDSSSGTTVSLPELQGIWVGTQTDVLNHLNELDSNAVSSMGDCEDGLEEVCDSVLEMDGDGTPTDATSDQLQFSTTAHSNLYSAAGSALGSGEVLYVILDSSGENAAGLHWKPGAGGFLTISMKSKYASDPGLPGEAYDARTLNGTIFSGTTYSFAADGSPNAPLTGQSVTVESNSALELALSEGDTLNGETVERANVEVPPPALSYFTLANILAEPQETPVDIYLGIFHTGTNSPRGDGDLVTDSSVYRTVVAIPSREDSSKKSLLVVTCDGDPTECTDGQGGNGETADISNWDITRYSFTLLTASGVVPR